MEQPLKTQNMVIIDDYLKRAKLTVKCRKNITGISINIEETREMIDNNPKYIIFTIVDDKKIIMGSAKYVFSYEPYLSLNNPTTEDPHEPFYNLNSIHIDECYNGKGFGIILLYYSIDYIFNKYDNIVQIQLDDVSDFGTSNNPMLRQQSIYQKIGFYRKTSVENLIHKGISIPIPNINLEPEHLMPSKNVHGLIGWKTKRDYLFEKIKPKLLLLNPSANKSSRGVKRTLNLKNRNEANAKRTSGQSRSKANSPWKRGTRLRSKSKR